MEREIYNLFEDFEYKGFWWLPEKPAKKVPGTGCNVARGETGKQYMQHKSNDYRIRILANENKTSWETISPPPVGEANYTTNHSTWFEARPAEPTPMKISVP